MVDKKTLIEFADHLEELEEAKKDAAKTVNEALTDFCKEYDMSKKATKQAIKSYWKWKSDRQNFLTEVNEIDHLIDVLTGEKVIEQISEDDL
jgi:hypothetical protein